MAKTEYDFNKNKVFVNPYNFIDVDWNNTARADVKENEGNLTGVIKCKLTSVSPLAIPGDIIKRIPLGDDEYHYEYEFMKSPAGKYMIPGSSIRGVIRSVYEAVTNSCFVTANDNTTFTQRAQMRENGRPYLLSFDGDSKQWILEEAEKHLVIIDDNKYRKFFNNDFKESACWTYQELHNKEYGQKISFMPGKMYTNKRNVSVGRVVKNIVDEGTPGSASGYLYIGEVPPLDDGKCQSNKHFEGIFVKKSNGNKITIDQKKIDSLVKVYDCYNDDSINRNLSRKMPTYYEGVRALLVNNKKNIPVYYREESDKLSLASIGRIAYDNTMGDLLYEKKSCNSREGLCKACSLFGTANKTGKVGSRIRVTDAIIMDDSVQTLSPMLKELSSPKTSYTNFYVDGKDYDSKDAYLRGRKVYWHNSDDNMYEATDKTNRNATMEILPKRTTFEFMVYFDAITDEQLRELKWALTLGDDSSDSVMCHKIGHGKPLGLGSVNIYTEGVTVREFTDNMQYIQEDITDTYNWQCDTLDDVVCSQIKYISNIDTTRDVTVSYPFIDDSVGSEKETAAFQWFSQNKASKNGLPQDWRSINDAVNKPFYSMKVKKVGGNGGSSGGAQYKKASYQEGEVVQGKVTGFNPSGYYVFVRPDKGGRASFPIIKCRDIKEEERVELKYLGKDPQNPRYDKWEFVRRI